MTTDELNPPRFPTMLRKMWSGGEVQAWIDENWNRRAQPAAPADAAPSVAPTAELWMYDFTDDGKPVKDWTTSSREEAFAPGHFNQRRYVPEQPAVPQDRTRSKDDLWRAHSTGPSPHWNVVLSAAAFHKARAVAGTQSTAEDAALYRGIQAYMHHSMPPDAAPSVAPEPVAWRYQDARGHYRYRAYKPGFDVEYAILKPVPLYEAHPPRAPLTEEIESADKLLRHLGLDPERCRTEGGSLNVSRIKTLLADAAPSVAPEPVAWEGGEGWESLAWELCADENGEDACNELIWEGGPIPEPWGDRWMKYEGEAKRLIALVHKHAAHPPRAPLTEEHVTAAVRSVCPNLAETSKAWRDLVVECRYWLEAAHGIGGK